MERGGGSRREAGVRKNLQNQPLGDDCKRSRSQWGLTLVEERPGWRAALLGARVGSTLPLLPGLGETH